MSRNLLPITLTATLLGTTAWADVPSVATDIAPVHSLVSRVMQGIGTPELIVAAGATPHEYSLRPSEAAALQDADLIFWIGPDLTPWMADAIQTLAEGAEVTSLMTVDKTTKLPFREGALFEAHDHDADDDDEHAHDDHDDDDHGHDDHAHEEHDDDDHGHDDHGHGAYDPHSWLSLDNGAVWLNAIAAQLSSVDPDNASAYFTNAAVAREEFDTLRTEINDMLAPVRGRSFIVFHDAYQYFEMSFNLPASGAISVSDATDPSPARIADIQARVKDQDVTCVLSEPQFDPKIVAAVMDGSEARTGVLDPLGSDLETGSELYGNVLRNLAGALADCL